ncbi:MAG: PliI family lysozyme inhibitor of I-type lysozyme [Desulfobulbus sp.]|jgi:hypothetical protein|nr:PliI family lysozyme inhibitor of I-type lysozyme [Desulfobulbus sp.]
MMRFGIPALSLLLSASVSALAADCFVAKLRLPTGQIVIIAEGDFEARSIGSFSVRLYQAAAPPDETTFFVTGLIRARDGVLEKAILADIDGDQQPEIVVIARSAGTGGYLSAYAFGFTKNTLAFRTEVEGLAPDKDPLTALRNCTTKPN